MLEIEDLVVEYGRLRAVDGLSIAAAGGAITTVIGSNGAGKTTTLRAVSGLVKPAEGTIRLLGERIDGRRPSQIVALGVSQVPEGRELFPRMTVLDNLMTGAYLRRDRAAIRADLDKVYHYFPVLKAKAALLARNLSGGEQQMLSFGRALMSAPRMLLLDEPSVGLAPLVERALMATVARLAAEQGVGVLLVEQNAPLALASAATAYVLDLGRVVLSGPAAELSRDPRVRETYLGLQPATAA